ncbi:MAG: NERD domain-containing protein [Actinomycetota bacterium]|nr:NERD domain-containing protein [Actinomycetota bacterium]
MRDAVAHWSLPEPGDETAGASAAERHRSLLSNQDTPALMDVPLADLLGPLEPVESTPVANWRRGAAGERTTAQLLVPLSHVGWAVIHDRRIPGSGANVDHLVIGPTGVWVVDSKAYRGRIKVMGDGRLWYGRRCLDDVLRTALWAADTVEALLGAGLVIAGVSVRPALCIHGAKVPGAPLSFDGVVLATPGTLLECLTAGDPTLADEDVDRLAAIGVETLPPAFRRQQGEES